MSDRMTNSLSSNPQTSSNEVTIASTSSITIESPKIGGRQCDFIWPFFNDMGPVKTPGHRNAQCEYCLSCFNFAKLHVMYSYISHQCDEIVTYNPNARKEMITRMRDFEQQSPPSQAGSADQLLSKQYTMDRFTCKILSYSEQQNIDRYLLRAVIMNGISFRTVNNDFFIEFVKKLNPSYDLPNRKKLAHEVLTQEVVYVENKNESLLAEAAHLTLNIDARVSTNINITSKIRAIVTDNSNTMQKMREIFISKPENQHILELRCFAHAINLIAEPLEVLVAIDKSIAPAKFINIINNRLFFHDIESLHKIMQPLAYAMTIIQSSSITLADCYLILSYLRLTTDKFVANIETQTFGKFVGKVVDIRLKEFQNGLYLSAYYRHPKYRGAGMLTVGRSIVYRYLAEYSKKIGNNLATTKNAISALQRYEIKSGPYALHFTQDDTPTY
ncbi:unnamed protein product [Rotaria sordida]|uniref:DUF659 domain-containing protein n=1 Tax=Rotaria sordida TaxID=392033 RepID=A0A819YM08_9BILA|nr:unnamed protein product [Rotaria sordida]